MKTRRVLHIRHNQSFPIIDDSSMDAPIPHCLKLDARGREAGGVAVVEHKKIGKLIWRPENVGLFQAREQLQQGGITGPQLRRKLERKPVLNAVTLFWLCEQPIEQQHILIPSAWWRKYREDESCRMASRTHSEEWDGLEFCFWGTIYRRWSRIQGLLRWGSYFVLYLHPPATMSYWSWGQQYIDWRFTKNSFAVIAR